jgi:uncharacterized protein with HEPN domain
MSEEARDYILFFEDILGSIEKIESYVAGLSYKDFCKNDMAVDAVIRNFEVIGEAARNIPQKIQEKHREVEWREAIGFRNVLIHDYFGIDVEAVWDTIQNNIPAFKKHIENGLNIERRKRK